MNSICLPIFNKSISLDGIIRITLSRKPGLVNIQVKGEKVDEFCILQIWKPILLIQKTDNFPISSLSTLEHVNYFRNIPQTQHIILIHYHGGDFCIICFREDGTSFRHKSCHKYVVRKKQGGKQSKRKKMGTAGSQMRILNQKALIQTIEKQFRDSFWINELKNSPFIGLLSPGHENRKFIHQLLHEALGDRFSEKKNLIKNLPFQYKKANYTNTIDAFKTLTRVTIWKSKTEKILLDRFFSKNKPQKKKKKKKKKKKRQNGPKKKESTPPKKKKKKKKNEGLDDILFSPISDLLSSASSLLSSALSPVLSPLSSLFGGGGGEEEGEKSSEEEDLDFVNEDDVFEREMRRMEEVKKQKILEESLDEYYKNGEESEDEDEGESESTSTEEEEDGEEVEDLSELISNMDGDGCLFEKIHGDVNDQKGEEKVRKVFKMKKKSKSSKEYVVAVVCLLSIVSFAIYKGTN